MGRLCHFVSGIYLGTAWIGYGTFTLRDRYPHEFLLEYRGELIDSAEWRIATGASNPSFMFFFRFYEKNYCIDGTNSSGLARMVNDLPHQVANCYMKKVVVAKAPHIFLFAKEYIKSGEELRYDYRDVKNMPWRSKAGISENLSEE